MLFFMRKVILFIGVILLLGCQNNQEKAINLLKQHVLAVKNQTHLKYKVINRYCRNNNDTIKTSGIVYLRKTKQNEIISLKIEQENGIDACFHVDSQFYWMDHLNMIVEFQDENSLDDEDFQITDDAHRYLYVRELIEGFPIEIFKKDSFLVDFVQDIQAEDGVKVIEILPPLNWEIQGKMRVWFKLNELYPYKIIYEANFNGIQEYRETLIIEIDFNSDFSDFNLNKFKDYQFVEVPIENDATKWIEIGDTIRNINEFWNNLSIIPVSSQLEKSPKKAELILMDFWYKSCYPCLKAFPKLQSLSNKYSGKGLTVIGVNPIDTSKSLLSKMLLNNKISYANYQIKNDSTFQINSYPTVLILENGVVIYEESGYSENLMSELESFIALKLED